MNSSLWISSRRALTSGSFDFWKIFAADKGSALFLSWKFVLPDLEVLSSIYPPLLRAVIVSLNIEPTSRLEVSFLPNNFLPVPDEVMFLSILRGSGLYF